jgi:hypothetical protein
MTVQELIDELEKLSPRAKEAKVGFREISGDLLELDQIRQRPDAYYINENGDSSKGAFVELDRQ